MRTNIFILVSTLKELHRERQHQGLKRYVRNLHRKKPLNGKEKFILRGATAHLNRLQADRRSGTLGLVEYTPYHDREDMLPDGILHSNFRAWDIVIQAFGGLKL